jgi:hypothetical protein
MFINCYYIVTKHFRIADNAKQNWENSASRLQLQ